MSKKWDDRLMLLALSISRWSKDPDHGVGAVIADSLNRVKSVGYNGPPRNVEDTELDDEKKTLISLHAELNAILNSTSSLEGCTIYIYPFSPCAQCAAAIIQSGIKRVVYYDNCLLEKWSASQVEALQILKEAKVLFRQLGKEKVSY